jgi:hypothetical protein
MTMNKVYVDNLIPGKKYHVVDMWDLERRRRHFRLEFDGIYVRRYPFGNIIRVVFREHGRERIVNSINEFYLIPPPPSDRYLVTRINRNIEMRNSVKEIEEIEETEEWIDDPAKIFNHKVTFPEDTRYIRK